MNQALEIFVMSAPAVAVLTATGMALWARDPERRRAAREVLRALNGIGEQAGTGPVNSVEDLCSRDDAQKS